MNEFWFIAIALIDLSIMLVCWKAGRRWLELFVVLNYIFANLFVAKFTEVFGVSATTNSIFYGAIFLGTDIITEHYGKRAGFQMIWKAFFGVVMVILAIQGIMLLDPIDSAIQASQAMEFLYAGTPRVMAASLIVFILIQRFDIWFYHWIHKATKGKMLWLRNMGSTFTSQILDTGVFFGLAFYATVSNSMLLEMIMAALTIKLAVALFDTPFIYLSYWIKGKPLSQAKHIPEG